MSEMRHYSRRTMTGGIEIVDRQFDFVRAVLPYDYRFTCNAQQWDEAERICKALEGEMISQGVISAAQALPDCALCDLEHELHEDAQGFHHVIKGERVTCPVQTT